MPTTIYNTSFAKLFITVILISTFTSCTEHNLNSNQTIGINFFESRGVVGTSNPSLTTNQSSKGSSDFSLHSIIDMKNHDKLGNKQRAGFYAYQVGKPQKDLTVQIEHLNQLETRKQCLIMRSATYEYYLIACCYTNYQMFNDSLNSFLSKLPYDLVNSTKIIHINDVCPQQHQLVKADNITNANYKTPINCLTCY